MLLHKQMPSSSSVFQRGVNGHDTHGLEKHCKDEACTLNQVRDRHASRARTCTIETSRAASTAWPDTLQW